jgi:predicted flap endonuclease-1-like 5' DNA nuclease
VRSAVGRARGLVVFLVLAVSAGWVLLRRRTSTATRYVAPVGSDAGRDVPATDAGLAGEPAPAAAPAALAAEEPGGPGEVPGDVPDDVLATDAGLTAEPAEPAADAADVADVAASEAPTAEITAVDDLRAVRGIGPTTEARLHELGITTFRQLAALEGDDLERVRAALPDFRTRIEREDWMGQARELHREKYGESP